jgi:hypothetical protein
MLNVTPQVRNFAYSYPQAPRPSAEEQEALTISHIQQLRSGSEHLRRQLLILLLLPST